MLFRTTATLETAILNVPQVVWYFVGGGKLFYNIMSHVLKIKYVSLVNLIADKEVVPEILGYQMTKENVTPKLAEILNDTPERKEMMEGYRKVTEILGKPGAPEKAAELIVNSLSKKI